MHWFIIVFIFQTRTRRPWARNNGAAILCNWIRISILRDIGSAACRRRCADLAANCLSTSEFIVSI
ncbi:MAG: hypothetical protein V2A61_06625 [Calditrichota bacterium]